MHNRQKLIMYLFVIGALLLTACTATGGGVEMEATVVIERPTATVIPDSQPLATSTLPPATAETAEFTPRFAHFLADLQMDGGTNSLAGLIQSQDGWQIVNTSYPTATYSINSDYALATDQLLTWVGASEAAGPGNLGTGELWLMAMDGSSQELIIPDSVVKAGWAPNGLDFAYILATPTSYELRWRTAGGEDKLLALDVPHSLRVSPDGRFVAFTRESHYGLTAEPGLYVVEIATGQETQVSTLDRAGYGGSGPFWLPHWSPDSQQLLLYATADDDRAPTPHPAGYVWAAADGSFSRFLPESLFLAEFDAPLQDAANRHCLDTPMLFMANSLIMGIGECMPMMGDPNPSQPMVFFLDVATDAVQIVETLDVAAPGQILSWDVPGESILLQAGEEIISYSLADHQE